MHDANILERIRQKFASLDPIMDERVRRQWAASEAMALGWGGVSLTAQATGLARNTITQGVRELEERQARPETAVTQRVRRVGAGRKPVTETDLTLLKALDALVDPVTRGHPPWARR